MSLRKKLQKKRNWEITKTTHFLLPIIGYPKEYYTKYFINSYIIPDKQFKLAIVFENVEDEALEVQLYRLNNYFNFRETYLDDDDKERVVIVDLDDIWKDDYNKFLEGSYSKFSKKLKDTLVKIHGRVVATGTNDYGLPRVSMYDVIYPSKEKLENLEKVLVTTLEKREVYDSPDLDREIYRTIEELKGEYAKVS